MSALMQRIRQDHINITRLMDILDAQVGLFHRGKTPDYNLMLDIMHYMMNYPNIAHHAVEEIVFEKLMDLRPELKSQAREITRQHRELAEKAHAFTDDLQAIIDGYSIMVRDQVEREARYYISLLREHLRQEEADLMPAAEQVLSEKALRAIETSIPDMTDPMANKQALKEYETLYKHITNEE
ncbi:MAG: hemerythrin domain-containing protein [Gammaproteobacteria bacterium]|nr:hemerythrin domain-containing protein [Gammaproteobacteria bacterium]